MLNPYPHPHPHSTTHVQLYEARISLIEDDADAAARAAKVPDWEMSEEFLNHAKVRVRGGVRSGVRSGSRVRYPRSSSSTPIRLTLTLNSSRKRSRGGSRSAKVVAVVRVVTTTLTLTKQAWMHNSFPPNQNSRHP